MFQTLAKFRSKSPKCFIVGLVPLNEIAGQSPRQPPVAHWSLIRL